MNFVSIVTQTEHSTCIYGTIETMYAKICFSAPDRRDKIYIVCFTPCIIQKFFYTLNWMHNPDTACHIKTDIGTLVERIF